MFNHHDCFNIYRGSVHSARSLSNLQVVNIFVLSKEEIQYFRFLDEIGREEFELRKLIAIMLRSEKGWNQIVVLVCSISK